METYGDPMEEKPQLHTEPVYYWDWGYYTLNSRKPEVEPLIEWQALLVKAFHEKGLAETISIGYIGSPGDEVEVRTHEDRTVIFLNENTHPTPELSQRAISKFKAHQQKG